MKITVNTMRPLSNASHIQVGLCFRRHNDSTVYQRVIFSLEVEKAYSIRSRLPTEAIMAVNLESGELVLFKNLEQVVPVSIPDIAATDTTPLCGCAR